MANEAPTAWTTTEAVASLTGLTVTAADIAAAQGIIELKTGVLIEQYPTLWGRDAAWIGRAVAYQAAFMSEHPDLFSRMRVGSASQEGQSFAGTGDYMTVAPLARAAMKRLSWKGTHSTSHERATGLRVDDDETDAYGRPLPWEPLT